MTDEVKPDVNTAIQDALATMLLTILKNGIIVRDADGSIVRDKDGNPMREAPNASYLSVARAYVKDHPGKGVPSTGEMKGLLKQYAAGGNVLPFDK